MNHRPTAKQINLKNKPGSPTQQCRDLPGFCFLIIIGKMYYNEFNYFIGLIVPVVIQG